MNQRADVHDEETEEPENDEDDNNCFKH
jgi:hypothetical protein